jgi:hypothetical protein
MASLYRQRQITKPLVRRNLDESIEELRQIADGRNDVLAEAGRHRPRRLVRLACAPCLISLPLHCLAHRSSKGLTVDQIGAERFCASGRQHPVAGSLAVTAPVVRRDAFDTFALSEDSAASSAAPR